MLALALAFVLLLGVAYYIVLNPLLKVRSAQICTTDDSTATRVVGEALEFAELQEGARVLRVLVMYATEYGFAREVARKTAAFLARIPVDVGPIVEYPDDEDEVRVVPRVINVVNFEAVDFSREHLVLLVCSTTGDGVPPNEAEAFREALRDGTVEIPPLPYAVLALGDSGYPHFCRGGIIVEQLLRGVLRGAPTLPRVDVDQEDWGTVIQWAKDARELALKLGSSVANAAEDDYLGDALQVQALRATSATTRYSRANPYVATLCAREELCNYGRGQFEDAKHVIRVELGVDAEKLSYTAGDAVGILPMNNSEHVAGVLQLLAANGSELVQVDGPGNRQMQLETALTEYLDLRAVRPELLAALRDAATDKMERVAAERLLITSGGSTVLSEEGRQYVAQRHVVDALSDFPSAQVAVTKFCRLLRALQTRYYSISSSPQLGSNVIAATLDVVRYTARGLRREGVASTYLKDRVPIGESLRIFVSRNNNFRLPVDHRRPVVMIGAGTGIAPYMAFLEERVFGNALGANVLFFGCRHAEHDFLYRDRLEAYVQKQQLKLYTAFSRDQPEKVYVTARIRENATEVWQLIHQRDAHVYVCGDGNAMARDVHATLRDVVQSQGAMDLARAERFLETLQEQRRYQRDVWVS